MIVHDVLDAEGVLADTGTQLEIVIDRADVADVLAAITGGAALSVVPVGAGRDRRRGGDLSATGG